MDTNTRVSVESVGFGPASILNRKQDILLRSLEKYFQDPSLHSKFRVMIGGTGPVSLIDGMVCNELCEKGEYNLPS